MTKIELALVELARLSRDLKRINSQIHDSISRSIMHQPENTTSEQWGDKCYWLGMAYAHRYDFCGNTYSNNLVYINHEDDIEGYLEENCKHALKAHQLIQERRPIKAALGVAKRRVTFYSNRLLAEAEHD